MDQETFETWNKIASLYEDKFMDLEMYNKTYDLFCNAISLIGADILEVGCGPGNITQYLLKQRPDFNIFGTDIAPNMITLAKKNNPTAHFEVMDCREIDRLDKSFDGIVCGFCLPYISSQESEKFIAHSFKCLNNGGTIYISFVVGDPNQSGYQTGSSGDRSYFYFHDLEAIKNQLIKSGFDEPKIINVPYPIANQEVINHTILLSKKLNS